MKKIVLAIVLFSASSFVARSQKGSPTQAADTLPKKIVRNISYNLGIDVGAPVGFLSKYSSLAYGASLQAEYPFLKKLSLTASVNYLTYIAKGGGKGVPFIPLLGGVKYFFKPKIFFSGQAGLSFYGGRDNGDGKGGSGEKYFTYAPGVGFITSRRFDVLLKYETVYIASSKRSYSFAGVHIGYNFSLH